MRCRRCNAEIEDGSLFCSECGAKQEEIGKEQAEVKFLFCPNCGTKLEQGAMFCSECGTRLIENQELDEQEGVFDDEHQDFSGDELDINWDEVNGEQQYVVYKKKGGSVPVVMIFLLIALLIVGGIGFAIYKVYKNFTEPQYAMESIEEIGEILEEEITVEEDEIDFSEVDINAVEYGSCVLQGKVNKSNNGTITLSWEEDVTIYALDEMGDPVLAEDVTSLYIDDTWIDYRVIDSIASNEEVQVEGSIYVIGNSIYLEAATIYDENGKEITGEAEDVLNNDYIISYSDTVLLTNADVAGLSLQEINYAKNEIYARHGRKFKSTELQNYFNSKSWYHGTIAPGDFTNSMLSSVEQKNAEFLSDVEFSMSPNGYQLDQ